MKSYNYKTSKQLTVFITNLLQEIDNV